MRMKAAVAYGMREPLVVEELELDPPKADEVLIKMTASGVCHSDVSSWTGALPRDFPVVLGHEGAGVVEAIGEDVTSVEPGGQVVLTFLPSCGKCRWCHTGHPYMCDLGQYIRTGKMPDGTTRLHRARDGLDIDNMVFISTFAEYTVVPEASIVPVAAHLPLDKLCLMGCGFTTGFGAATNAIHIRPGETVTIVGCGGLGLAAIQGCVLSGAGKIIAVDVHEEKLTMAKKMGATHTIQHRQVAEEVVKEIMEITWGLGTDYSMEFVGGDEIDQTVPVAFGAIRKGGTMLMVGVGHHEIKSMPIDPYTLTLWRKKVQGVLFGDAQFRADIPRYIDLFEQGKINLDDMITKEYRLEQINEAFDDVLAGNRVARGIIRF